MNKERDSITISVGDLASIASTFLKTQDGLNEFNRCWRIGEKLTVTWDLTELRQGKVNVAATSFFLAIAHRVRAYSDKAQPIMIDWKPKTLSFLSDIGFFSVSNKYDLFEWPYNIGGFDDGLINPNTLISSYDLRHSKEDLLDRTSISELKKHYRELYRSEIVDLCDSLFFESDRINYEMISDLPLILSRTCAELVTNAIIWGGATAFVGLQRAPFGVFINVSDIGIGIKNSLINKNINIPNFENGNNEDINSVLLASAINEQDFGLKRAISTVIDSGGDITISSNSAEVHWAESSWSSFVSSIDTYGMEKAIKLYPSPVKGKTTAKNKESGYHRVWSNSIRGTRITFFVPLGKKGVK